MLEQVHSIYHLGLITGWHEQSDSNLDLTPSEILIRGDRLKGINIPVRSVKGINYQAKAIAAWH